MKLAIEIPPQFNNKMVPTVRLFYLQLFNYLIKQCIDYSVYPVINSVNNVFQNRGDDFDFILKYHTIENNQKVINIKISYLPDFFYFDKTGYSGWAELAVRIINFEDIPLSYANKEFQKLVNKYVIGNVSKYIQKKRAQNVNLPSRFIFLATQVEADSVMSLSYVTMMNLIEACARIIPQLGYNLVIKRHPCCKSEKIKELLKSIENERIFVVDNSIHDIIERSSAVIVINSGVGIESLLHLKPVITFGRTDYHWVTFTMKNTNNLIDLPNICAHFDNAHKDKIKQFIVYFFKKYSIELHNNASFHNAFKKFTII